VTGNQLRIELDRLIHKERFKDAVKQAKLCYKQESTPENHQLLEQTYFFRARQLVQEGMPASAVEVARHLLDFGVTPGDWVDDFIGLLMTLGLNKDAFAIQERFGSPQKKDLLVVRAADEAVIHSDRQKDSSPEIARDAALIRQSLERLQAKDEAGALQLLRDLARSSVLSEWKFFVRGLAAHYRGDAGETKANWDRLDPARKAFPITQRLLRLKETDVAQSGNGTLKNLEKLAFGEPVLDRLRQLCGLAAGQEWDQVVRLLGPLNVTLRRIDPALPERLTGALIGTVIKEAEGLDLNDAERLIERFTRAAEPLAFDPRWNRLWAILWDGPQGDSSVSLEYWEKYVDDLKTVTVYNPSERALAQAMVWNHMAGLHRDEAAELADGHGPFGLPASLTTRAGNDSAAVKRAKRSVVACLDKSLELAPSYLPTYQSLVEVYRGWDDTANLEAAARRLLAKFPDDFETLQLLANHYVDNDEPASALPLVQKARALKPLDESLRDLEWFIRVGLARTHALAKQWEAGRNEFAIAEQLKPDCRDSYAYLARRVMFEAKAGQREPSDAYLTKAQATLNDPTPLWLALAIESIRFGMTKATQKGYAQLWEAGLKNKCQSETAGEMAALMYAFLSSKVEYTGRAAHIKKVGAYLQRTSKLKYKRVDIERVCEFLGLVEGKNSLLEKMIKLGIKQHPESALLNFRAGLLETERGFFGFGGTPARKYLETAMKLAEASTEPDETALLPQIKSALTLLNEMGSGLMGFPAFGNGPPGFPFPGPLDEFLDYFDDDFDDDDDDDDDPGPSPSARPRSPTGPAKKKSSKKR
jgi:tetratricopeptide (TPR) repeat protein